MKAGKKSKNLFLVIFSKRVIILIILVVVTAYYLGVLLFGYNSFDTLMDIEHRNSEYKKEVDKYQEENAELLRQYLELKSLEP
jgi:cell division protein FtsB